MKYLPLTYAQKNIFAREITSPGTDINNLYFVLQIREEVDVSVMREAIRIFIRENAPVRTRIENRNGVPMQYTEPYTDFEAEYYDLSGLDEEEIYARYRSWGQKPKPFYQARMFDFKIVRLKEAYYGLYCEFHHIWCDGYATGLIWSGILTNYLRLMKHETPHTQTYTTEVFLEGDGYSPEDEQFWKDYLQNLSLAEDYLSEEQRRDKRGTRKLCGIDKELSDSVKEFCEKHGIRPYIFFMAVMSLYTWNCTRSQDLLIGTIRLNRNTPQQMATVGMAVMDAPIRISPKPDQSFLAVCEELTQNAIKTSKRRKYPFTEVVEHVRAEQNIERDILDFTLSFQKAKIDTGEYHLPVSVWFGPPSVLADNLIMHILDLFSDGYTIFYDYKFSMYSDRMIGYMHEGILGMIRQAIEDPEKKAEDFTIIGADEAAFIDSLENKAGTSDSGGKTMVDLFLEAAAGNPQKTAFIGADQELTYEELNDLSDRVASYLQKKDVHPDDIVLIMLPRDSRVLVSMLGIWKAGGAFCCVDPDFPEDRIEYITKDSEAKCRITPEAYQEALGEERISEYAAITPKNLCYAIYTSGTTGRPKGVMIEHCTLVDNVLPENSGMVADMARVGRMTLAITSLSFDVSLIELFYSLINGICCVMAMHHEIENINLLAAKMNDYKVNVVITTPSRLLAYMQDQEFYEAMAGVDYVMVAGEAFIPALYDKIKEVSPDCLVYNCYGPSETFVTTWKKASKGRVNLGIGVKNYVMHILDKKGRRVPFGRRGELCIGGIAVSDRGYRNLPEETKKKYVQLDGKPIYRSGDLSQFTPEGELEYYGRIDTQVKIRGFRIELGEIEHMMTEFPGIDQSAVIVKHVNENDFLCAFYTAHESVDTQELKQYLQTKLPHYMIPSAYVHLEKLPVNLNGKMDTKALAKIEVMFEKSGRPPVTEAQKILCNIFESVLHMKDVGIDDNFFELGGNSLLAARIVIEANAAGIALSYSDIFSKPTVMELARNEDVRRNIRHYDYAAFDRILEWKDGPVHKKKFQNVLVTGTTGFLGLHVLKELLDHTDCRIYALVRRNDRLTPEKRLDSLMFYYFSESCASAYGSRLFVVTGDISSPWIFDQPFEEPIDLIFNCAADVSHFTYGSRMFQVNVEGVRNLLRFADARKARMIQISTPGVGMFGITGQTPQRESLTESDFYFGQDLSNAYTGTKFMAEREVLEAVLHGTNACIMRVGNLQGRFADGEFQINMKSNAFMNTLKVYAKLGFAPESVARSSTDYTPIDCTARAIVLLAMTDSDRCIWHVFNNHKTSYAFIFDCMKEFGYPVERVSDEDYDSRIRSILADQEKRSVLVDIVDGLTRDRKQFEIPYECPHTMPVLKELGFEWPEITKEYVMKCLQAIIDLGAFD